MGLWFLYRQLCIFIFSLKFIQLCNWISYQILLQNKIFHFGSILLCMKGNLHLWLGFFIRFIVITDLRSYLDHKMCQGLAYFCSFSHLPFILPLANPSWKIVLNGYHFFQLLRITLKLKLLIFIFGLMLELPR